MKRHVVVCLVFVLLATIVLARSPQFPASAAPNDPTPVASPDSVPQQKPTSGPDKPANYQTAAFSPDNDSCGAATIVPTGGPFPYTLTQNTVAAGTDPGIQGCGSGGNSHHVFFKFTPPADGTMLVKTCGSNYNTVISIHTGACGGLTQTACNDDVCNQQSGARVSVSAGTTYYIAVGSYGTSAGGNLIFTLNYARTGGIRPDSGWQATSLSLQAGDPFRVDYLDGAWTIDWRLYPYVGPEGYVTDPTQAGCKYWAGATYATLLGKIGSGSTFAVGRGGAFTANATGPLYLRINDSESCAGDNDGTVNVRTSGGSYTGCLRGRVVDALSGQVMPNVQLALWGENNAEFYTTTNAAGEYAVDGMPPDTYWGSASRTGFYDKRGWTIQVSGTSCGRADFQMDPVPMQLGWPVEKTDAPITSLFDHEYALYDAEPWQPPSVRQTVVDYAGRCWGQACTPATVTGYYSGHNGVDLGLGRWGTGNVKVFAAANGVVVSLRNLSTGYGRQVVIDHRNGYYTLYGHLASTMAGLAVGTEVTAGQEIGRGGSSGNSSGPHLHFGIYRKVGQPMTIPEEDFAVDPCGWQPSNPNRADPWESQGEAGHPPSRAMLSQCSPVWVTARTTAASTLASPQSDVVVEIPAGLADVPIALSYVPTPLGNVDEGTGDYAHPGDVVAPLFPANLQPIRSPFLLATAKLDGSSVDSFQRPLKVTARFESPAAEEMSVEGGPIQVYRWIPATGAWGVLPATIDTTSGTAIFETMVPGTFAILQPRVIPQAPLPDKFLFAIGAQAPVAQFDYPNDVALAPDGTVYVTDSANHRVQHLTATGQFLQSWGSPGVRQGQFWVPSGVVVAPDGKIYVSDSGNARIQIFASDTTLFSSWGIFSPDDIVRASDGSFWVIQWSNTRLAHLSSTGQLLGYLGSGTAGSGDGQFNYPEDIAVASDGTLYVADTQNHRIQRFSAAGIFLGKWGTQGSGDDQFNNPRGIAVAPDGSLYVSDSGNHRVQRFSSTGQYLAKWGGFGSGDGQLNDPRGITVGSDGVVYIADFGNHRIQRFSATGQFLGKWGTYGKIGGQFNHPNAIARGPDGSLYVTDNWNSRIGRLSSTGMFLTTWGSPGSGDGQFSDPNGLAVGMDGTIYVADRGNHRIQRFSADGTFLGKWGGFGNADGQFSAPHHVAVAPDGTIYVTDNGNRRVQYFTAAGTFLGKWGSQGDADGQFQAPNGVAVAADGTVYVTDTSLNRIQQFSARGQFLGKWGSQGGNDGQFNGAWDITVAPDQTVYVTDWINFRVQRFTSTGTFLGKWGRWHHDEGAFAWPAGVAVGPDGTAYVAEWDTSRVQAFGAEYPTTWRAEYFDNRWLAGAPILIRNEATIDHDWGTDAPGPGVPADNFSARWQRYASFDAGTYRFSVTVDDGVRLWVDERLLIEQWHDQGATAYTAELTLTQGYHRIRMEYYENSGPAAARLSWAQVVQMYTISGRITDNTGAAIAGAIVNATGVANASTTSGSDGRYSLTNLLAGTYSVSASKTGYIAPAARSVSLPPDANNVDFVLQPQPTCGAVSSTPYFTSYFGDAVLNGQMVAVGSIIEAFSPRGDRVGCFQVTSAGLYGYMRVYGEDTSVSPSIPGMRANEEVIFKISNTQARSSSCPVRWQDDKSTHEIDLTAPGACPTEQKIDLHSGLNWFSIFRQPAATDPASVLSTVSGKFSLVLGEDGTYAPPPADPRFNTLGNVLPGKGYMIRMNQSASLTVTGNAVAPNSPLSLASGLRWLGYLPERTIDVSTALSSLSGKFSLLLGESGTYAPPPADPRFNTLQNMEPGRGYLIRMTQNGTLTYPATLASGVPPEQTPVNPEQPAGVQACNVTVTPYFTQFYGEVTADRHPAPVGALIEAFSPRGDQVGCFQVTSAGLYGYMRVYGEDTSISPIIPGMRSGETVAFKVNGHTAGATGTTAWQDDKAIHAVNLAAPNEEYRMYLPLIISFGHVLE